MIYVIIGITAFILFLLYDVNSIITKNKLLNCCFFTGVVLLIAATAGIIITSWKMIKIDMTRLCFFGVPAALFFGLLIYTLFFALPFKNTYVETDTAPGVCNSGVYALCRHPGVIWFAGFYLFMGLALMIRLLLTAAVIFSLLDILYVLLQDRWTFIKSIKGYDEYRKDTPFLIPNMKSIERCIRTL